jgi:murein L,D-transpeptidase YcbB/YkuD
MKKAKERFDRWAEAALKRFQAEHRLDDDGVFGPKTRKKFYRALEKHEERLEAETATEKGKKKSKKG